MLLDYGADVTMQDRPDLAAVLRGERFYAEVKHFNRKAQDDLNDAAVRNAPEFEFVLQADTTRIEGKSAYRQIADVAIKKTDQYREGEINILIIDSDSETLHLMARSGAQEFSHSCPKQRVTDVETERQKTSPPIIIPAPNRL
jgi:hypothetical protein